MQRLVDSIGPYVFLLIGGIALFSAFRDYRATSELLLRARRTTGTVIRLAESRGRHGTAYAPVIRYVVGGLEYHYTSNYYRRPPAHRPGDRVVIVYDPDSPGAGKTENALHQYRWLGVFGFAFIGAGVLAFWIVRLLNGRSEMVWRVEW